jgi:hypothetical protein
MDLGSTYSKKNLYKSKRICGDPKTKGLASDLLYQWSEAIVYFFDCIVRMGHQGSGRSFERHVRVRADNAVEALRRAKVLPGVKKGCLRDSGASVLSVAQVR